ncbi:MAG: response regulator [Candidatus Accumulibacter sp.]|jgi:putative two-component system response regulator|nr:response regulator [Accumulibacter sp.]
MENYRKLIMVVDDSISALLVAKDALSDAYKVMTVPSALKMLEMLERHTPDLILLDVVMPEMSGYEAIKILKKNPRTKKIPVIFLTAMNGVDNEIEGLNLGAVDYITKPFLPSVFRKRVAIQLSAESGIALFNHDDCLQDRVTARTKSILGFQSKFLKAIVELVEGGNGYRIESGRPQHCLGPLLSRMNSMDSYKEQTAMWDAEILLYSSQLHDVGKIITPNSILKKPGKLTVNEFDEMKSHVPLGVGFIKKLEEENEDDDDDIRFLQYAEIFAGFHHERWDGSGYPNGLMGENIPLLGRLMAIADVYEALTSERPYKKAFPHNDAVRIILEGRGKHFDPALVDVFEQVADRP